MSRVIFICVVISMVALFLTGCSGSIGPVGPQGPDGSLGAPGEKGDQGQVGPQGEAGYLGPKGEQGEAGTAGAAGKQGSSGLDGASLDYSAIASRLAHSVVRVYAEDQAGESIYGRGTGFFSSDDCEVTTARHVVEHTDGTLSSKAQVHVDDGQDTRIIPFRVTEDDADLDLAWLTPTRPIQCVPMKMSSERTQLGMPMLALSYMQLVSPDSEQTLVVTPGWVIQKLANIPYLLLDMQNMPGISGAPILTPDGKVVGVAVGGGYFDIALDDWVDFNNILWAVDLTRMR